MQNTTLLIIKIKDKCKTQIETSVINQNPFDSLLFINPSCASFRGNCDVEKRNLVCSRNKWHKAGALYL